MIITQCKVLLLSGTTYFIKVRALSASSVTNDPNYSLTTGCKYVEQGLIS